MVCIANAHLSVEPVPAHAHHRLLTVSYDVTIDPTDPEAAHPAHERVVVRSVDLHDAPVPPAPLEVELADGVVHLGAGFHRRRHATSVARVDLDVGRDWWDTGLSGETVPLSEFPDHLVALVELSIDGAVHASATSEVVTGSWGPLGSG